MPITRVHLTAGDGVGWAIDEDLRLVREALEGACEITSFAKSEAVHAGWWANLLQFSRADFRGRHVVCSAENPPFYYVTQPEFLKARSLVTTWIARSSEATKQFAALGIESRYAPYTFDPAIFHPLVKDDPRVLELREKWKIPNDRYLISNFHRDTEGADLVSPKLQKGPDLFLEIVAKLHAEGTPIHVLLAGPRRFWLRRELKARGVPFSFVGSDTQGREDLGINTLPRPLLNLLYNLGDVHLITSRWEGGPQSILEAAGSRCKILSTAVGLAHDVLEPECLFSSIGEACERIRQDIATQVLEPSVGKQFDRVHGRHTSPVLREHLVAIYRSIEPLSGTRAGVFGRGFRRAAERVRALIARQRPRSPRVLLLHSATSGAASVFDIGVAALRAEFVRRGCVVADQFTGKTHDLCIVGRIPSDRLDWRNLQAGGDSLVVGLLDEQDEKSRAAAATFCKQGAVLVVPSLDALLELRKSANCPADLLVVALPAPEKAVSAAAHSVVTISPDAPWSSFQIQQASAVGTPVLYPAASEFRSSAWFGGLPYATADEVAGRAEELRNDYPAYQRLARPASISDVADRLLRLIPISRELADGQR